MLSKVPFYHQTIRKCIIAFGKLFNDIYVVNNEQIDQKGKTRKIVKVPIVYGEKNKWFVRLTEDPQLKKEISSTFPRITFEIVGMRYDNSRKLNSTNRITNFSEVDEKKYLQYAAVPYNLDLRMYIGTLTTEDAFQILEQILPYFHPSVNLTVKTIPEMDIVQDMPITLVGVNMFDSYDGSFEDRRKTIYTLDFEIKINIHPNTRGLDSEGNHFDNYGDTGVIKRVITDFEKGFERQIVEVDPFEANENDPHVIRDSIIDIPPDERG